MNTTYANTTACSSPPDRVSQVARLLQTHYEATQSVRIGICLLNAGQYEQAQQAFIRAQTLGCAERSLPSYLASCLTGQGDKEGAAEHYTRAASADPTNNETALIRKALALWEAGKRDAAIQSFRDGIAEDAESAEIHFQLGTLLAAEGNVDEAELRFIQVISLDPRHSEAFVSLALCHGANGSLAESIRYLKQAQQLKPSSPRIGQLLTQALQAQRDQGPCPDTASTMPAWPAGQEPQDREGIKELARVIEAEPDFVDAFISLQPEDVDETIYSMLLRTLQVALERQPEHAELHYHCGQILSRLGRPQDAIKANEKAVELDGRLTRALIALGRLYAQTDRRTDAIQRLEQAVEAGGAYADVFYALGNLYREGGCVTSAESAYRQALSINNNFEAARQALEALPR